MVFGEDVAFGGVFRCTMVSITARSWQFDPLTFGWQGLAEEFGQSPLLSECSVYEISF